jgi:hypothetical protein
VAGTWSFVDVAVSTRGERRKMICFFVIIQRKGYGGVGPTCGGAGLWLDWAGPGLLPGLVMVGCCGQVSLLSSFLILFSIFNFLFSFSI